MFAYVGRYGKLGPMTPSLTTERLVLRPMASADADVLHAFWIQPEVRRYLWDGRIISPAQVAEFIAGSESDFAERGFGFFVIHRTRDGQADPVFAGFCGFRLFDRGPDVELLYGILPEFWGEGIVTEAAHAVLGFGFGELGFERVLACTDTPNQRSVRVMRRLGMEFQERREYHGLDTVFYALERTEYQSATERGDSGAHRAHDA